MSLSRSVQKISPPLTARTQRQCAKGAALYNAYSGAAWQLTVKRVTFLDAEEVDQLRLVWELHRENCEVCG